VQEVYGSVLPVVVVPASHGLHPIVPVASCHLPFGQFLHVVVATTSCHFPTSQRIQDADPEFGWYCPAAQSLHVLAPADETVPLPQIVQEGALLPAR
tara:strand:+ start:547 stop:837 length:291 start_codon:yes stop_codon:yes gene_type:complete